MKSLSEAMLPTPAPTLRGVSVRVLSDALLFAGLVAAAILLRASGSAPDDWLPWLMLHTALVSAPALLLGFYRASSAPAAKRILGQWSVLRVVLLCAFSLAGFVLLPWPAALAQGLPWQLVLATALIFGRREALAAGLAKKPRRCFLVLGHGPEAARVHTALAAQADVKCAGLYPLPMPLDTSAAGPLLSAALPLERTVRELGVTDIVVAVSERRGGVLPQDDLLACRLRGVRVFDLASFFEREFGQVRLDHVRASWLIFGEGFRQGQLRVVGKRVFDLIAASLLALASLPLMLLTALAIVLDSPGPVFYRQERVGQGGRIFSVIKFRSMRTDAERDGTPRWASARDDRITRVGRIIRRYRIDELPQLWNVLCGQMSLIGPRPERAFFVSQLAQSLPFYSIRHSVKPGLTGWAQVRYHYGESLADAAEKLQYDLYYLKHGSLAFDLAILLATVRVVLKGQGAH